MEYSVVVLYTVGAGPADVQLPWTVVTEVCPGKVAVEASQVLTVLVTVCAGAAGEQDPWKVLIDVTVSAGTAGEQLPWIVVTDVCPGNVIVEVDASQVPGIETVLVMVCAGAAGEQDF